MYELTTPDVPEVSSLALDPANEPSEDSLPPAGTYLISSNIKVDQGKFYGSTYFLNQMQRQADKLGLKNSFTGANFRFLGDPFYESHLINESILKATQRQFLHDEIATPEEQVKYLIDNATEVHQDLNLSFGVALSKEQISKLNKDIIWYVHEKVEGHQVLAPKIYLAQSTIAGLRSPVGTGLHSRGKMQLDIANGLTNTGNISSKEDLQVRANTIINETMGSNQATIQSTHGSANLQAENDLKNLSGKIAGKVNLQVKSVKGSVINETKLLNESTLHTKASLEAGASLVVEAEKDIINKAAGLKAGKDAKLKAVTGDVLFLTQVLKEKQETEHTSHSSKNGLFSSQSKATHSKRTHETTKHAVSDLEIGGNLSMEGRDITFEGTDVKVKGEAVMKASRNFNALAVEDTESHSTSSEETTSKSNLFSSSSNKTSQSSSHKKGTSRGPRFDINGQFKVVAGGDANFVGSEVTAGSVEMDIQGKTSIRAAYNEDKKESTESSDNKNSTLVGLFKDDQGKATYSRSRDKTKTGNNWNIKGSFKVVSKQDILTESINLHVGSSHLESKEGSVIDRAAQEVHEQDTKTSEYTDKRGFLGFKTNKQQGRLGLKLQEKRAWTKKPVKPKPKPVVPSLIFGKMPLSKQLRK